MFCYIIYSPNFNKYYTGFCQESFADRLLKHNTGFYKNTYSSFTHDWETYLILECQSISQALAIEKHIKKMKSVVYIQNLKKYPEMGQKLLDKFEGI
jgi:putative endonuclease